MVGVRGGEVVGDMASSESMYSGVALARSSPVKLKIHRTHVSNIYFGNMGGHSVVGGAVCCRRFVLSSVSV